MLTQQDERRTRFRTQRDPHGYLFSTLRLTDMRARTLKLEDEHRLPKHSFVLFDYTSLVRLKPRNEEHKTIVSH